MRQKKMMKRVAGTVMAVLILCGGSALLVRSRISPASQWIALNTGRGDLDVVVTAVGTISADAKAQIETRIASMVARLYADWNIKVVKQKVIGRFHTFLDNLLGKFSSGQADWNVGRLN